MYNVKAEGGRKKEKFFKNIKVERDYPFQPQVYNFEAIVSTKSPTNFSGF